MKNLYIHIGAKRYVPDNKTFFDSKYVHESLGDIYYNIRVDKMPIIKINRAIVGVVDIIDIVAISENQWHISGQYGWTISNVRLLKNPILNVIGKQKIWNFDADENMATDLMSVDSYLQIESKN